MQSDPIGLCGGINTYAFVGGNPVTFMDQKVLLTSQQHMTITATAMRQAGYGGDFLVNVTNASVGTVFSPTFKIIQAIENAFKHAMKNPKQWDQEAYRDYENYLDLMINQCDATGLGNALHAVQDSAAGGHNFETYTGSVGFAHMFADFFPFRDRVTEALVMSANLIDRFKEKCSCQK